MTERASVDPNTFAAYLPLPTVMSQRLREHFSPSDGESVYEGPHFVFEQNSRLFLGRRGRGPLRIAWDTNLLIDYFEYGRALWDGAALPEVVPDDYGEELEGLQLVVTLWILRDIRFYLPHRTLQDARRGLSTSQATARRRAFEEFAAALSLVEWPEGDREPPPLLLPESAIAQALRQLPAGQDTELVDEALRLGAHVFMTRDRGLLKSQAVVRPYGLRIASPLDVVDELAACGALHCLLDSRFAYWPLPDLQRVTHLIHALPD
jgi:hypothetical protein